MVGYLFEIEQTYLYGVIQTEKGFSNIQPKKMVCNTDFVAHAGVRTYMLLVSYFVSWL